MASLTLPLPLGGSEGGSIPCQPLTLVFLHGRFSQNEVQQIFEASGIMLGQQSRGQIQFNDVGAKCLVTAYARLGAL